MENEDAVLKAIKRSDYIFAGHSHADHIADIPFIAKKFGSKVIGSQTTTNLALTGEREDVVVGSGTTGITKLWWRKLFHHPQPAKNRDVLAQRFALCAVSRLGGLDPTITL